MKRNGETLFIRQLVNLWLVGSGSKKFTVLDIKSALEGAYPATRELPLLRKGISNDLIRRERMGQLRALECVANPDGAGRPARLYEKIIEKEAVAVLTAKLMSVEWASQTNTELLK